MLSPSVSVLSDLFIPQESLTLPELVLSFGKIKPYLLLPETEDSWERIFNSLEKLEGLCRSGACEHPEELTSSIRSIHRNITNAMNSERTRLSGAAIDVINALALGLSANFEPLMPLFLPPLILLCGRANKVVVSRAKTCILAIIGTTQLPGILPHLTQFVKEKSPAIRLMVAEGTHCCLKCFNPPDLEKETHAREVESIIRSAVRDANADVRKVGKDVFQSYKVLLPHRVERCVYCARLTLSADHVSFAAPLTPTVRKYLQLGAGTVPVRGKTNAMILSRADPTSKSAPHITTSKYHANLDPIRPPKKFPMTTLPKPGDSIGTQVPLRSIQVPPKRGESRGVPYQRRPPGPAIRSVAPPTANTTGPQRVIKSSVLSEGPATLNSHKIDAKSTRLDRPGSTTLSVSKSANSTRQLSSVGHQPVKGNPAVDSARTVAGSRDLTRPTLSQLARVKPPVVRASSKPVPGLNIHKTKSSVDQELHTADGRGLKLTRIRNERPAGAPIRRPITPASIPLPSSPDLPSRETYEPYSGKQDPSPPDEGKEAKIMDDNTSPPQTETGAGNSGKFIFSARGRY